MWSHEYGWELFQGFATDLRGMLGSMKKPYQEWVKGNSDGELNESIWLYSNLFKQSMNLKGILKGILGREIFLEKHIGRMQT